jgi:hypothetical protein
MVCPLLVRTVIYSVHINIKYVSCKPVDGYMSHKNDPATILVETFL